MNNCVRIALFALLALVSEKEYAAGQAAWPRYNDGQREWEYKELKGGKTCKIRPSDRSTVAGEVTIPSAVVPAGGGSLAVVEIAADAFKECENLTKVTIKQGVTTIGQNAFDECSSLREAVIPEGVVKICSEAFRGCSEMQSLALPASLREMGKAAFCFCKALTEVAIPEGVEELGISLFQTCTHLKKVTIPMSVRKIHDYAFYECYRMEEIFIPDGVTKIGASTFEKCSELVRVNLPPHLKRLETYVFKECGRLESVTIPSETTTIDKGAFVLCSRLARIDVEEGNGKYCSKDGIVFSKDGKTLECYPRGRVGAYAIPDGVTMVGREAFAGCEGLDSIYIPTSVTAISTIAFGNTRFASVTIPSSVKTVDEFSFTYCERLKEVVLLASAESITFNGQLLFDRIAEKPILYVLPGERAKFVGAQWVDAASFEVRDLHVVTFDADGGEPGPAAQFVKSDGKHLAVMPEIEPAKAGYTFAGWVAEGTSRAYDFSTPVTSSFTLKASWRVKGAPQRYGVVFTVRDDAGVLLAGAKVEIKSAAQQLVYSGVTDAHGQAVAELENGQYAYAVSHAGSQTGAQGGLEVASKEVAVPVKLTLNVYTVTFNPDNGSLPFTRRVRHGALLDVPAVPTKRDSKFMGWFFKDRKYEFIEGVTGDMVLTARWMPVPRYTVAFDARGGTPEPGRQQVLEGGRAMRPTDPVKPGYLFKGWLLDGEPYAFDAPVRDNITLVALWEFEGLRVVAFNADGGAPEPPQQRVKDGALATRPADPVRPGYRFMGWYLQGVLYSFDRPVTGDITLVARWEVALGAQSALLAGVRLVGNPVDDVLELEGVEGAERIEVYSLAGVPLYARAVQGESRVEVAVGSWASGVYVVRVVARDGARALRVVKR